MQDFTEKVVVMAATNLPSTLDDGLINRFETLIHIRYYPLKKLLLFAVFRLPSLLWSPHFSLENLMFGRSVVETVKIMIM